MRPLVNFLTAIFSWIKDGFSRVKESLDSAAEEPLTHQQTDPVERQITAETPVAPVPELPISATSSPLPEQAQPAEKQATRPQPLSRMSQKQNSASHPWHDLSAGQVRKPDSYRTQHIWHFTTACLSGLPQPGRVVFR